MQKTFNSVVILSKGGVLVPAIVIKSQLQADGREFLSLLYADPFTGPGLVLAGGTRKVGSVELTVQPLSKGAAYGWLDYDGVSDEDLRAHSDAVIAGNKPPIVEIDEADMPGVHGLPSQANESDVDRKSRLANVAHQHTELVVREVADGSGTGRYGDNADHWTETGDGKDYPGSYGVGPDLKVGNMVRVIEADGKVNPDLRPITKIESEGPDGQVFFVEGGDSNGYFRDRVVRTNAPVPTGVQHGQQLAPGAVEGVNGERRGFGEGNDPSGQPLSEFVPFNEGAPRTVAGADGTVPYAGGRIQPHGVDETFSAPETSAQPSGHENEQQ